MSSPLPLVFDAPRRAMPPRHLADLDEAGRAAAVAELGLPAFRAKQLANQYYGRLIADPHQMTDLPAAVRDEVAEAVFPRLMDAVREIECDAGETRKMLWRAVDGTTFESVLMRYPDRNTVCISSPGRLRHGMPVLRDRPRGVDAQPVGRRDPGAGPRRGGGVRGIATTAGCPTSCSWAWASRWPTTTGRWRRCGVSRRPRRTASVSPHAP